MRSNFSKWPNNRCASSFCVDDVSKRKKHSIPSDLDIVVINTNTTTKLIQNMIWRMLNDARGNDLASSDFVSGIIFGKKYRKITISVVAKMFLRPINNQSATFNQSDSGLLFFQYINNDFMSIKLFKSSYLCQRQQWHRNRKITISYMIKAMLHLLRELCNLI